ncbi:hypothetical protein PHYC_03090 [Phycisphaerales bacterium]|nr:hypothetical protein PHYC_03090 [Phycisphaerales bacterium]
MIARTWHGWAANESAASAYVCHFLNQVMPALRSTEGFVGAQVLRANTDGEVEFRVVTYWESMDAVRRFAGPDPEAAVIADDARRALARYDTRVRHHEVLAIPGEGAIERPRPA